ncbi:MAG: hypothetical protein ACFCD0_11205 [Gemmataceae bacterium]
MTRQRTTCLISIVAMWCVLPGCTPSLAFLTDVRERHHDKRVWGYAPEKKNGRHPPLAQVPEKANTGNEKKNGAKELLKLPPPTTGGFDKGLPAPNRTENEVPQETSHVKCPACETGLPGPHGENCPHQRKNQVADDTPPPKVPGNGVQAQDLNASIPPHLDHDSTSAVPKDSGKNKIRFSEYPPKAKAKVPAIVVSKNGGKDKETPPGRSLIQTQRPIRARSAMTKPKVHKLAMALQEFLRKDPTTALKLLEEYDPQNQELYLRILPLLAALDGKPMDQLTPEEYATLTRQLEGVIGTLRAHAAFQIDEMCVCQEIQAYGAYTPWPKDHAFRASDANNRGGDCIQVYVQFRNLIPVFQDGGYAVRLSSSTELLDAKGTKVWSYNFGDQDEPLRSQKKRRDYFLNYSFYTPHVPPGRYTLRIRVQDLTRPGHSRVAQRSVMIDIAP